jgi:type IV pilus assembly protein PilO
MEELLNKVTALSRGMKLLILGGIIVVIGGGYWYFFYGDILEEKDQDEKVLAQATAEKADYDKRKTEYLAFRNEVNQLLEEQKELLRVLPKRDDIEQFIENVNAQVELSGLSKVSSVRDKDIPGDMYTKIPIRMSLVGGYHQINKFFNNIGGLQRIVTIADLQLKPSDSRDATKNGPLQADFVAQTFQFVDKGGPMKAAAKPAGAPAKAPPVKGDSMKQGGGL